MDLLRSAVDNSNKDRRFTRQELLPKHTHSDNIIEAIDLLFLQNETKSLDH